MNAYAIIAAVLFCLLDATAFVSSSAQAATVITARPVIISRPVVTARPVARSSPVTRTSYSGSSPTFLPLYVPIFIATSSSNASAGERVQVATPLLTICSAEQFKQAKAWQSDCKNLQDISGSYCPLLSYFRFCKEATPDEVRGLKRAGENYRHVFMAE